MTARSASAGKALIRGRGTILGPAPASQSGWLRLDLEVADACPPGSCARPGRPAAAARSYTRDQPTAGHRRPTIPPVRPVPARPVAATAAPRPSQPGGPWSATVSAQSAHELSCTRSKVHLPRGSVYDLRQSRSAWSGAPRHVYPEITPNVSKEIRVKGGGPGWPRSAPTCVLTCPRRGTDGTIKELLALRARADKLLSLAETVQLSPSRPPTRAASPASRPSC